MLVVDGRQSMRLVPHRASRTDVRSHPHGISGLTSGFDEDVGALTHAQGDHVGGVRPDRDEVVRNHSHLIPIDSESLQSLGASVDEPETVRLSGLELELGQTGVGGALGACWEGGAVEVAFTVDEVVIRVWLRGRSWVVGFLRLDNVEVGVMVPVGLITLALYFLSLSHIIYQKYWA